MPLSEETWESSAHDCPQLPNDNCIYALIIGISNYQFCDDLDTSIADGDAMRDFLLNKLKAPPNNIIHLVDAEATRQGILDAFERLEINTASTVDPCMIIYYAGYVTGHPRPKLWPGEAWSSNDLVEQWCPNDLGAIVNGEVVEGISGRVIGALVASLSQKRGNNITLIMDCCFSAEINHHDVTGIIAQGEANRILENQPGWCEPAKANPVLMSSGFGDKHNQSHVLLAAYSQSQVVRKNDEDDPGTFTKAMLEILCKGENLDEMTYASLIENAEVPPWQTTHCLGAYSDRPVFNRRPNRSNRSYMPCRLQPAHGKATYILYAGRAHGIAVGQKFSMHEKIPFEGGNPSQPSLGTLQVVSVAPTSSRLEFFPDTKSCAPQVCYARPLSWTCPRQNPSTIYCQDNELLDALVPTRASIRYTEEPAEAALIFTADGDRVHIDQNDTALNDYIPTRFVCDVKRNEVQWLHNIIRSWRQFNYILHRHPHNSTDGVFSQIRMELQYLAPVDGPDDYFFQEYHPVGENLLAQEPAFVPVPDEDNIDGSAHVLGMTIYNDGPRTVYPYLFYFDPNDLTITPWEIPTKSTYSEPLGGPAALHTWVKSARSADQQSKDARILPRSKLTLGYGDGGGPPWEFVFVDDRAKDVGFFRLFLSTTPANFACLSRTKKVFEEDPGWRLSEEDLVKEAKDVAALEKSLYDNLIVNGNSWGVKSATVVQIRPL